MAQVQLLVTDTWWERCQSGIKEAVSTLQQMETDILKQQMEGGEEPIDTLDRLYGEIMRIRKRIETFQIPF